MLKIDMDIIRGTIFVKMEGDLTDKNYSDFERKINQLLYKYGMHSFVFNFSYLDKFDDKALGKIQNKVVEILLNCGRVIFCGLDKKYQKFKDSQNRLVYVDNEMEAFSQIE